MKTVSQSVVCCLVSLAWFFLNQSAVSPADERDMCAYTMRLEPQYLLSSEETGAGLPGLASGHLSLCPLGILSLHILYMSFRLVQGPVLPLLKALSPGMSVIRGWDINTNLGIGDSVRAQKSNELRHGEAGAR